MKTLTFNTSINIAEKTKESWKPLLVKSLIEKKPDVAFLQECFNFHYWIYSTYLLLPLFYLFQNIPLLNNLCQAISMLILVEGYFTYALNSFLVEAFGYSLPFMKTYNCYDDFLYKLEDNYNIYYDKDCSNKFNTIMNSGLYILIRKDSYLTYVENSFKTHTYSCNNGADQKVIEIQVRNNEQTKDVFHLFTTQLHYTDQKYIQLEELKKFVLSESMLNPLQHQIILSGDFNMDWRNDVEREKMIKFLEDINLTYPFGDHITTVLENASIFASSIDKTLDYILVSDSIQVDNVSTPNLLKGSEHLALISDLRYKIRTASFDFFKGKKN